MTRIEIDDQSGTARDGALQVIELAAPPGALVTFTGTVILRDDRRDRLKNLATLLGRAVRLIPAVGAHKGAGFGEVVEADARLDGPMTPLALPAAAAPVAAGGMAVHYRVTFDRRVLVDAERVADNVWRGAEIIPGAVFKGALAERLRLAGVDTEAPDSPVGAALAALRIGPALPEAVDGTVGCPVLPDSLVTGDGTRFFDRLAQPYGSVPHGSVPLPDGRAPRFQVDWKDREREAARAKLGWPAATPTAMIARGHTRIGPGYTADEGNLYIDIARSHRYTGTDIPRGWRLSVCLGADAGLSVSPALPGQLLAALEEGLDGIGSTGARATFTRDDAPPHLSNLAPLPLSASRSGLGLGPEEAPSHWVVMRITPAMLVDPHADTELIDRYRAYWDQTVPGATLVNFFARHRLTGGYLGVRRRLYGRNRYYPFLLTEPGAVFLLAGTVGARLAALAAAGLPPQRPSRATAPLSWRTCPYLPENGYGAIVVNPVPEDRWLGMTGLDGL